MKAFVDPGVCIGCTLCTGICPEVYTMDGSLAHAMEGEIPGEYASGAAEAAQSCPVNAIELSE